MSFSKASIYKWVLIFLIILTCITDIATFFYSGLYEFEINPIVLFFKGTIGMLPAIIAAVTVKSLLILASAYFIYSYKPKNTHLFAFLIVNTVIFIIAVQIFGIYANVHTTIAYNADPVNVQPMPVAESTRALNIVNIVYYCVMAINLLSFWFYEKMYTKR